MYDYQQRMSRPTGPDYVDTSGAQGFFEDGWLMFSGLMIFFVGFWNAFEGGLAFLRSAYFAGTPVFGSLAFWAVVWIAIGVFEIGLAMLIMRGNNLARWAGVAVVAASTTIHMLGIVVYPWWSLFVMALDLLILYGLIVRWREREAAAC